MKTISVILLVLLASLKIQSQENRELIFNEKFSDLTTERLGYAPTVFVVKDKPYQKITKTSSKRISQEYIDAVQAVKFAEKDSIDNALKVASTAEKQNAIDQLKNYINSFLKSNLTYDLKKGMLKNAQKISNKYNLGHLIYADSELNNNFKSKFFVLSRNKLDLKVHLNKIIWKMNSDQKSAPQIINNDEDNLKLAEAREHLKNIKKFEVVSGTPNVKNYKVLTLGEDVLNPEEEIYGHYETLGEYYVLTGGNGYKPEQVVPAEEVERKQIKKENFVFEIPVVLIQHSITKSTYLVSPGFIDQYAINRIASQERFKGKTAFPKKIYRNEKDKLYDSLIFDYNKSRIASMTDFD